MKKNKNFFFSIIIPFYNLNKKDNSLLYKCLNSLKKQTLNQKHFEILLINDGSLFFESKKITNFKKKFINFQFYNLKKNEGQGMARNHGLKKANAKYIVFLDADDELPKHSLEQHYKFLQKKKVDLITFNWKYKNSKSNKGMRKDFKFLKDYKNKKNFFKKFLAMNFDGSVIFTIVKKDLFLNNKIIFPEGYHEDIPVIFQLYYYSKKIIIRNKVYYLKNKRNNSVMQNFNKKRILGYFNSWKFLRNFCIKKYSKKIFKKEFENSFISGIKGIIAIMVLENFRLNKNIKKKISNYHEISKLFSIIFGKLIFKKALQYGNSSKYDMITEIFTKKYITESKKISFKIFEQKIQKLEKNEI